MSVPEPCTYSLFYRSNSTIPTEHATQEVQAILKAARAHNAKVGITGALTLHGDTFAQFLEGPEEAVRTLYQAITRDPRHQNLTLLHAGPADQRNFSRWHMALAGTEGEPDLPLFVTRSSLARAKASEISSAQAQILDALRDIAQSA